MTTFTYSLMSDMHVNFPQPKTPYDLLEQNVIVAGDTANGLEGLKFLHKLQNKGHRVFATLGNHEHYSNVSQGRDIDETRFRFEEDFYPRIDVDDVLTVLLVNGWYPVTDAQSWYGYMNDGRYIVGDDPLLAARMINEAGIAEFEYLYKNISESPDRRFIVVTHTAPCLETLNPRYEGHYSNEWYWNPRMMEIMKTFSDQILIWNHGHTHTENEAVVHGVRVVCNPRGYPRENPGWKPKTFKVEY